MNIINAFRIMTERYTIQKWNEKKEEWEYVNSFLSKHSANIHFNNIISKGIYRLIKIIDIKEIL